MGMAIDAITISDKIDVAVLVSGDGDFSDLVYHLRSRGVLVEAISFLGSTNEDLIKAVDFYFPIENDMLLPLRPGGTIRSRHGSADSNSNLGSK